MPASDGFDQLVESATGIALGALAVDMVITDTSPAGPVPTGLPGPLAAAEPEAAATGGGVEDRVQFALETYLTEALSEPAVDASQLPAGFAQEDPVAPPVNSRSLDPADELAGINNTAASSVPIFRPFSELTPTEQVPLTYPRRALEGAEGSVDVEFTFTETGEVIALSIEGDAPAVFIQEAVRAITSSMTPRGTGSLMFVDPSDRVSIYSRRRLTEEVQ